MTLPAVNWNDGSGSKAIQFWNQNVRQFWVDEEIPLSDDKLTWKTLSKQQQETYKKATAGLTILDTTQGSVGMPKISLAVPNLHEKAILGFMCMMEHMHAKSYSTIFSTLTNTKEIDELFNWANTNKFLNKKLELVTKYYDNIQDDESLYMALSASVFLESFLFYSGFYYPLLLAGQGKLVASGEIINLIIRDESIHGLYVGLIASQLIDKYPDDTQLKWQQNAVNIMLELMENELEYTNELYGELGLVDDVTTFLKYNADKALMNLSIDPYYEVDEGDVNPIVISGLSTKTKNHDFFSTKGNGYIKPTKIDTLNDNDFDF